MHGLDQIKSINAWAASQQCKAIVGNKSSPNTTGEKANEKKTGSQ